MPNAHRWIFVVEPVGMHRRPLAEIRLNVSNVGRALFGPFAKLGLVTYLDGSFSIDIRDTVQPVTDEACARSLTEQMQRWAVGGFGIGTKVSLLTTDPELSAREALAQ
jgi:hypothetical protein